MMELKISTIIVLVLCVAIPVYSIKCYICGNEINKEECNKNLKSTLLYDCPTTMRLEPATGCVTLTGSYNVLPNKKKTWVDRKCYYGKNITFKEQDPGCQLLRDPYFLDDCVPCFTDGCNNKVLESNSCATLYPYILMIFVLLLINLKM